MDDTVAESKYSSRKFILTILVVIISTGLFISSPASFTATILGDVMIWALGLYITGNVGQKLLPIISSKNV